jgi:hypothetical protein
MVESMPGGGRRRVLRPWGLRSSAPLTESPAIPEIAAAHRAAQRANEAPGRRLDLMVAGGVAVVAIAGLLAYPYANADETRHAARDDGRRVPQTDVIAVPMLSAVRESPVSAPPLVERLPGAAPLAGSAPKAAPVAPAADSGQRRPSRPSPALVPPPIYTMPADETVLTGDVHSVDAPAPLRAAVPATPIDPWHPLRNALGACARSVGVWERATCEQSARLAHCEGYWGNVALCPSGRTDFGQ